MAFQGDTKWKNKFKNQFKENFFNCGVRSTMNYFPNEATITGQSSKRNYHLNFSGNCPNGRVKMHIIDMDQKCGTLKRHIGLLRDLGKRKTIYIYGIPYFWQCAWCFLIYFASLKSHKSSKKYCKLIDFITFT